MDSIQIKLTNGKVTFALIENSRTYLRKTARWVGHSPEYKKGLPWLCGCKGRDRKIAPHMRYENGKMFCPECGKEVEILKTVEDLRREADEEKKALIEQEKKARENIHMCLENQSISSGMRYYSLSTRIEPEDWKKISHLFRYHDSRRDYDDDEQDTWDGSGLNGWLTTSPHEVEKILNDKPELRLSYREEKDKIRTEKRNKVIKERDVIKEQIVEHFNFKNGKVTQPWADESKKGSQGASMITWPEGQSIEDPKYPFDIYGGGRKWVINHEENKIWQINNNGHDGDNWGLNNVATGGAGAIGVYIEYTEELESLIKKYVELYEKVKQI